MAVIVECEKRMKFAAIFLNYQPPWSSASLFLDLKRLRFPPLAASMAEKMVLLCVFETFCLKFCGISSVISIVTFLFAILTELVFWECQNQRKNGKVLPHFSSSRSPSIFSCRSHFAPSHTLSRYFQRSQLLLQSKTVSRHLPAPA